jgi:hypothetical protein
MLILIVPINYYIRFFSTIINPSYMVDMFIFDLRFLGFSNQLNVITNLKFICKVPIDRKKSGVNLHYTIDYTYACFR